ncbi:MAG: ABC transporter ATP-binding protein [Acidobacteriota bacterium]
MPTPDTVAPQPTGTPPGMPAVRARGLTRLFGVRRALAGVDLELRAGEFLTIFGPNGAGKTTLLKTLSTLLRPSSGTFSVFGTDPRHHPELVKRRIGLIAHSGYLYDGLTGRDNLLFFARLYDVEDSGARVEALLRQVGLQERAADPVRTYSRGMRQRLSIARALVQDPDLILLDEPYTGLDRHASRMLRGLLEHFRGRRRSVIMVTHHLEEGLALSDRIGIMVDGRIVLDTPTRGLSRESLETSYHRVVGGAIS